MPLTWLRGWFAESLSGTRNRSRWKHSKGRLTRRHKGTKSQGRNSFFRACSVNTNCGAARNPLLAILKPKNGNSFNHKEHKEHIERNLLRNLALAESALAQPPEKSIGKRQTSHSKNQDLPQIHPSAPGGGFATRLAVFIRLRIAFPLPFHHGMI